MSNQSPPSDNECLGQEGRASLSSLLDIYTASQHAVILKLGEPSGKGLANDVLGPEVKSVWSIKAQTQFSTLALADYSTGPHYRKRTQRPIGRKVRSAVLPPMTPLLAYAFVICEAGSLAVTTV